MPDSDSLIRKSCPFCKERVASRGLHSHVRNSDDDVHGPAGTIPDGFDASEVEITPESRNVFQAGEGSTTGQKRLYLCHYCGEFSKGKRGFSIHLSKNAGDFQHPEDVTPEDAEYTTVPCDEDWEPYMDEEEIRERRFKFVDESLSIGLPDLEQREGEEAPPTPDFPDDADKPERVAILLNERHELYHEPKEVMSIVGCSRTTFYEGRSLYDQIAGTKQGDALF